MAQPELAQYIRDCLEAGHDPEEVRKACLQTGWQPEETLLDPMCGGGTLLSEAAMIGLKIPPGAARGADTRWPNCSKE